MAVTDTLVPLATDGWTGSMVIVFNFAAGVTTGLLGLPEPQADIVAANNGGLPCRRRFATGS